MTFDLTKLNDYVKRGLVAKQRHPALPISIYCYTRECQFNQAWNEYTLNLRGTVIHNETGEVIARPFSKFFNIEETERVFIPNEPFEVFEKMDGSLGILFYYNKQWMIATKGSFESDQSVYATKLLKNYDLDVLDKTYTYLFEIIYKDNQIVVEYDFEKLILLAAIHTKSGVELKYEDLIVLSTYGFDVVPRYDKLTDLFALKSFEEKNKEGFVVKFKSGYRLKVKFEEYVKMHSIVTGVSAVRVWEYLRDGKPLSAMLDTVPDEFDKFVKNTEFYINITYQTFDNNARKKYRELLDKFKDPLSLNRAKFAEFALKPKYKFHAPLLFSLFDGNYSKYSATLWKMVRPKIGTFKIEEDEE